MKNSYFLSFQSYRVRDILKLIIGITVSVLIFLLINLQLKTSAIIDFETRCKSSLEVINKEIELSDLFLNTLAKVIEKTENFNGYDFDLLSEAFRKSTKGFMAIEWAPYVLNKERSIYEEKLKLETGNSSFSIKKKGSSGFISSENKENYVPVTYIQPLEPNKSALGLDLLSEPIRAKAINEAIASDDIVLTNPLKLVQLDNGSFSYLSFKSVKRSGNIEGFLVCVFNMRRFLEEVINTELSEMNIRILDENLKTEPIFSNLSEPQDDQNTANFNLIVDKRNWKFQFSPILGSYKEFPHSLQSYGILILGIVITVLFISVEKQRASAVHIGDQKKQFLANMSHEIRNPVNVIHGMSELLKNPETDVKREKYIDAIHVSSNRLIHLLDDILTVSKLDSFKVKLRMEEFNIRDFIDHLYDDFVILMKGDMIFVNDYQVEHDYFVKTDSVRLNQILSNLLRNAIKHSQSENEIILRTELLKKDGNTFLQFRVIDHGIGIPEDKIESIFDLFEQVGDSMNKKGEGVGLGLTISKKLVTLMNGNITVVSKVNFGTEFCVEIPCDIRLSAPKEMPDLGVGVINRMNELNEINILVADDDLLHLEIIEEQLSNYDNLNVELYANGKRAISNLNPELDMLIIDYRMPGLDGIEIVNFVRNKTIYPINSLPIIMISANTGQLTQLKEIDIDAILLKPFREAELFSNIYNLVVNNKPKSKANFLPNDQLLEEFRSLGELCYWEREKMIQYIDDFRNSIPKTVKEIERLSTKRSNSELANFVHSLNTKLIYMNLVESRDLSIRIENHCRKTENIDWQTIETYVNILTSDLVNFNERIKLL